MYTDKKITAHMVVKNEDQWVWFAIMSVIDFVDRMIIFDTGSVDKTVEVIKTVLDNPKYQQKIHFEELGEVSVQEFPKVRQRQLDMTDTEYMMIVDGDEIWWKESLEEIRNIIDAQEPLQIFTKFICPCVDIRHYRDFSRESYIINGIKGSITTRILSRNIEGLNCTGDYGVEGYSGKQGGISTYSGVMQEKFYFHCSHMRRSSAKFGDESISYRRKKIFNDWDHTFPRDYKYPEVFYVDRPDIVPDPFKAKDNLTKRISKFLVRIYRYIFKHSTYTKRTDRD